MNVTPNPLIAELTKMLGLFLSISFGVFIFILFFQPFPLDRLNNNNILVFVTGLAAIVLFFLALVRVIIPVFLNWQKKTDPGPAMPAYLSSFLILTLTSIAFPFYLHYVGSVTITFLIMFKVVILCSAPAVALWLYDRITDLNHQIGSLIIEKKIIQKKIEKYEEDFLNKPVEFISETSSEKLTLTLADVVLIKSADNYVEIIFQEDNHLKKKLIRNTLKNVENQIRVYSNFIRCHRTCIVNTHHVEKLEKSYHNHWITVKGLEEPIPVSRQYLLKLKETV